MSKAFKYYEQALQSAREIASVLTEAYALINLSSIAGNQMDAARALDYGRRAYEVSWKLRDRSAEAWCHLYLGRAYLLLGDLINAQDAFLKSTIIRDELGQASLSMESLAGLVETALLMNDYNQASEIVEKILGHFDGGGSLEGTDEPLRVYDVCYQFLTRQKNPRAQQVLQKANQLLEAQVSKFSDEETRKRFVEIFPWRKSIYDAGRSI